MVPLLAPVLPGANVALTTQVADALTLAGQSEVSIMKSLPVSVTAESVIVPLPVLVKVKFCCVELVPTLHEPKANDAGDKLAVLLAGASSSIACMMGALEVVKL